MRLKTICLALVIIVTGLAMAGESQPVAQNKAWGDKMNSLLQALSDALPDIFNGEAQVTDAYRQKVKRIYEISREIDQSNPHGLRAPDSDPGLAFISKGLREDLELAYQSLDPGSAEYSKGILKRSVSYCIACHTRTQNGPQFPMLSSLQKSLEKASWVERVSIEAATRRFDEAYSDVMAKLEPGAAVPASHFDSDRAVKVALTIAVRVKNSPESALLLAEKTSRSQLVSESERDDARSWIADIKKWQAEKPARLETDRDLLAAARRILKREDSDEPVRMGGGEVRYLRASNLMHRLLREDPKSSLVPEALYLIGLSYDALAPQDVWNLSDLYFRSCVEAAPHSGRAEECFHHYQENVILGFTGSSGTHVPAAISAHLRRIGDLAARSAKPQSEGASGKYK